MPTGRYENVSKRKKRDIILWATPARVKENPSYPFKICCACAEDYRLVRSYLSFDRPGPFRSTIIFWDRWVDHALEEKEIWSS